MKSIAYGMAQRSAWPHRVAEVALCAHGLKPRKVRHRSVNLLAGRAVTRHMHPLTALGLSKDFDLRRALRYGCLPLACTSENPHDYFKSYASTYLRKRYNRKGSPATSPRSEGFLNPPAFPKAAC